MWFRANVRAGGRIRTAMAIGAAALGIGAAALLVKRLVGR